MIFLWIVGFVIFTSFFLIVFRGAPWVPTHGKDVEALFELYSFRPGDTLVDLGSGDGKVLHAAARHGVRSVGYELNPFLVAYSRFRLRKTNSTTVHLEDFWASRLPESTAVVFVFLAKPFMKKLERKLRAEATRLQHDIVLVSYGMEVPGRIPEKKDHGLILYRFEA